MSLEGRGAVVTGGGRGIGAATAKALARAGASVVLASRTASEVERVAQELRGDGCHAFGARCDVTNPADIKALAGEAQRHLGRVDILVNNAGVVGSAPLHHLTLEEWNRMFAVNATGTFLCTQAFLPGMLDRGWGRVINIASIAGLQGARYIAAYSASKHAVMGFTRCVAADVAARGVTVNAICPGYVNTMMTDGSLSRIQEQTHMTRDEALEAILSTTPQHRLIEPVEVAHAVLSLCAEDARGINGQSIVIDGGKLLS